MEFPEDIYSNRILEVVASMPPGGLLPDADGNATRHSKLCGSKVRVSIRLEGHHVADYGQEVEACLLGQTAAAVMAKNAVGLTRPQVVEVRDQMLNMLKNDGPPPSGKWADLEVLYPVKDYKPRHTSMMLVFEALIDAIDDAAQNGASSGGAAD